MVRSPPPPGGAGAEVLDGGPGDDTLDGNQGVDVVTGGAGIDVVTWDPGDGSDTIDGGADTDRLAFNGANVAEILGVSAVGDHVRFTRNSANIVLDLDGIESLDIRAFGGADVAQVSSVAGTDLATITTDLAASVGGDDGQPDEVTVPAGVAIGQDATAGIVDGLGARVRVTGGAVTDRIHVVGTAAPDAVAVFGTPAADTVSATANGTDVTVSGATPDVSVLLTGVESLSTFLVGGADSFSATGNLAALVSLTVDGGAGTDTILGGNGADNLSGGADADLLDGNQGIDVIAGGAGDDVVQWDPGDGNDTVDGGADTDRLAFNGANVGEIFGVSAVGDHVRFTRNIANIVLDLDGVETLGLRALGGADSLQIDSLAGTDLAVVEVSLGDVGGNPDLLADQITLNGTAGDDTVSVVAVGSGVEAQGLAPLVRIKGADPTLDRLTVNGLAGSDAITGSADAAARIVLDLVP